MALKCPHVVGVHDIRIHDYGPGRMFGSIHAEVPDKADLVEVHAALDVLEDELQDKYHMEVNIHMDPLCTDIHQINAVRRVLDQIVHEKYPRYHTDHLRITQATPGSMSSVTSTSRRQNIMSKASPASAGTSTIL